MKKKIPHIAIALFGGLGKRFGESIPKQFLDIGDKPLLFYVLKTLDESPLIDEVIVVSHPDFVKKTIDSIKALGFKKEMKVIEGGEERVDSVRNALTFLREKGTDEEAIVLIQDGDRPGLDESLIKENILMAEKYGAAVTAISSSDTVFLSHDGKKMEMDLPRRDVYRAQTPQTFKFGLIEKAYEESLKYPENKYTDDASIALDAGISPAIVKGSKMNIKITEKEDALFFLQRRK